MTQQPNDPTLYLPLSNLSFHVLLALGTGPAHGYAIGKEIEARSEGKLNPTTGALYQTLKRLSETGLIERAERANAKVVRQPTATFSANQSRQTGRRRRSWTTQRVSPRGSRSQPLLWLCMMAGHKISRKLYEWTLVLLPRAFHRQYAVDMKKTFSERVHQAYAKRGTPGVVSTALREISGALLVAWQERRIDRLTVSTLGERLGRD